MRGEGRVAVSNREEYVDVSAFRKNRLPLILPALSVIWIGVVGIGLSQMWEYEATPGELTNSPATWPTESRIERGTERPTLVVFAHPRCPCTRASIDELSRILTHCQGKVDAQVLFFKPSGSPVDWPKTDLWSAAQVIPGVSVIQDESGFEATRFSATTSGHSLLYDSRGRLLFSGGITGSRGHAGDNVGKSAIESLLLDGMTQRHQTFVFGCPLQGRVDTGGSES